MAKLIENTVVGHPDTGDAVVLLAGDSLPKWAEKLVGVHLLDEKPRPEVKAPDGSLPPKSGNGSSQASWLAYARSEAVAQVLAEKQVTIADDAKQSEIIAALEAAGVPTEKQPAQ